MNEQLRSNADVLADIEEFRRLHDHGGEEQRYFDFQVVEPDGLAIAMCCVACGESVGGEFRRGDASALLPAWLMAQLRAGCGFPVVH